MSDEIDPELVQAIKDINPNADVVVALHETQQAMKTLAVFGVGLGALKKSLVGNGFSDETAEYMCCVVWDKVYGRPQV